MLLALLKRIVLEMVFCFTYCKMNQRFILWRLLFCWYIQDDKYIYIEYLCVLSIFDAVCKWWWWWFLADCSRLAGKHEQRAAPSDADCDQLELQATSLLIKTFKTKLLLAFYANLLSAALAAPAASKRGLWEVFLEMSPSSSCFTLQL